jgi:predicted phage tail protein
MTVDAADWRGSSVLATPMTPSRDGRIDRSMATSAPSRSVHAAVVSHGLLAAWLLVNGVAHTASVLAKANAGTLRAGASVASLSLVGAGLTLAGVFAAVSAVALFRHRASTHGGGLRSAWASLAGVAAVLTGVGVAYGAGTLGGSVLWMTADAAVLAIATLQQRSRPGAIQRGSAQ